MGTDLSGSIKYVDKHARAVFRRRDLVGLRFWDLMANYNKVFLQGKYGDDPFDGMSKQKDSHVIRFSLDHLDEDMKPVIVTCKLSFIREPSQSPGEGKIKGVMILARRSSEESTKNFQSKIEQGVLEVGIRAIKRLNQEFLSRQVLREALNGYLSCDHNWGDASPSDSGLFDRNLNF